MAVTAAVHASGLVKAFGELRAVDRVDLEVGQGEIFGVLGPNGAGKTTVLRMLATLLPIDAGRARVFGVDVAREPHRVRQLAGFAWRQADAPDPLIPPRIVLDRNRGGAYLTMLIAATGMFGVFLFLTYYIQQTLGFSPAVAGVAFLPMVAGLVAASALSNVVLMPRTGPALSGSLPTW